MSNDNAGIEPKNEDWLLPAALVGVVVVLGLIIAIVAGVRAGADDDESVAGQLEQWSSCLRGQGANVPLVEALRDGGFRVTVDGSLVEDGIDTDALGPALDACKDDAPEAVRKFTDMVDGFSEFPYVGTGSDVFHYEDALDAG